MIDIGFFYLLLLILLVILLFIILFYTDAKRKILVPPLVDSYYPVTLGTPITLATATKGIAIDNTPANFEYQLEGEDAYREISGYVVLYGKGSGTTDGHHREVDLTLKDRSTIIAHPTRFRFYSNKVGKYILNFTTKNTSSPHKIKLDATSVSHLGSPNIHLRSAYMVYY